MHLVSSVMWQDSCILHTAVQQEANVPPHFAVVLHDEGDVPAMLEIKNTSKKENTTKHNCWGVSWNMS